MAAVRIKRGALARLMRSWLVGVAAFVMTAPMCLAQLEPENAALLSVPSLGAMSEFGTAMVGGDFDGNGHEDLAVGIPGANQVRVYFNALVASQDFTQDLSLANTSSFGRSLAVCDFDEDGRDDLVVGSPDTTVGAGAWSAGRVHVYSGGTGVSPLSLEFSFDENDASESPDAYDFFGFALAAGHFFSPCDLAVGVPGQMVGGMASAGAVRMFEVESDFSITFKRTLTSDLPNMASINPTVNGFFGASLLADHFETFSRDDLVVAAPEQTVDGVVSAGMVFLMRNTSASIGPNPFFTDVFTERSLGLSTSTATLFGRALVNGDFNHDGEADFAIGSPFAERSPGDTRKVGRVYVIYGANAAIPDVFHQDVGAIPLEATVGDQFGWSLAAGNWNGDRFTDLAVGVPGEDGGKGAVHTLQGAAGGLSSQGSGVILEADLEVAGTAERFAESLATADLDADGADDLAVGMPFKDAGGQVNQGIAYLIPSASHLVAATRLLVEGDFVASSRGVPESVASIEHVASDEDGRPGVLVEFSDGTQSLFAYDAPDWAEVHALDPSVVEGSEEFAFDSQNRFAIAAFDAVTFGYLIWTDQGMLAREADPVPGTSRFFSSPGSVAMAAGRAYFSDDFDPEYVYRDDGNGAPEGVAQSDTFVPNDPLRSLRFSIAHDGSSLGAVGSRPSGEDVAAVDGVVVAEEGSQPRSSVSDGRGFTLVWGSLTSIDVFPGGWILRGILSGGGNSDRALVDQDGVTLSSSTMLESGSLLNLDVSGTATSRTGDVVSSWSFPTSSRGSTLAVSCGSLASSRIVLSEGRALDFDDDGVLDAKVDSVSIYELVGGPLGPDVDARVRLREGTHQRSAIVRLRNAGCSLFEDGFESGDTSAWQ